MAIKYISTSGSGSGNGDSEATAWTMSQFNGATKVGGNEYKFKRGDVFTTVQLDQSGSAGNPIIFGTYGTGASPRLSGLQTLTFTVNEGNGVWSAPFTNTVGVGVVTYDDNIVAMGRYPKTTWKTYKTPKATATVSGGGITSIAVNYGGAGYSTPPVVTVTGDGTGATATAVLTGGVITSITFTAGTGYSYANLSFPMSPIFDLTLTGSSWVGAELAIRKLRWIIDRHTVTAHSGVRLDFNNTSEAPLGSNTAYPAVDGYGYFFQNHANCLSTAFNSEVAIGDWRYDRTAGKLYMYFGAETPSNHVVKATNTNIPFNFNNKSYLTFNDITFEGGNQFSCYGTNMSNIIFNNPIWRNSGGAGLNFSGGSYITLNSPTIINTNGTGVYIAGDNVTALNTVIDNIGMFAGMGGNSDGSGQGLVVEGNNNLVRYLNISNVGYVGMGFKGSNFLLEYFDINGYCFVRDDGGGVYTYKHQFNQGDVYTNRVIQHGIIRNGQDASAGSNSTEVGTNGAYMDDYTENVTLNNLFIYNIKGSGVFLHGAHHINVTNNTIVGCSIAQLDTNEWIGGLMHDLVLTGNKYIILDAANQLWCYYHTYAGNIDFDTYFATANGSNNNVYASVLGSNNPSRIRTGEEGGNGWIYRTLSNWQALTDQDDNSSLTAKTAAVEGDIRIEFNSTSAATDVSLGAVYKDVEGNTYNGTVNLPAYSGKLLIYHAALTGGNAVFSAGKVVFSGGRAVVK